MSVCIEVWSVCSSIYSVFEVCKDSNSLCAGTVSNQVTRITGRLCIKHTSEWYRVCSWTNNKLSTYLEAPIVIRKSPKQNVPKLWISQNYEYLWSCWHHILGLWLILCTILGCFDMPNSWTTTWYHLFCTIQQYQKLENEWCDVNLGPMTPAGANGGCKRCYNTVYECL